MSKLIIIINHNLGELNVISSLLAGIKKVILKSKFLSNQSDPIC